MFGIADRVSNGPGFQVGVLLFEPGAHYSSVIGYDAFLQDSYEGFSGAVGLEVRGVRHKP